MTQTHPWLIPKPVILAKITEACGEPPLTACWSKFLFYSFDLSIKNRKKKLTNSLIKDISLVVLSPVPAYIETRGDVN